MMLQLYTKRKLNKIQTFSKCQKKTEVEIKTKNGYIQKNIKQNYSNRYFIADDNDDDEEEVYA